MLPAKPSASVCVCVACAFAGLVCVRTSVCLYMRAHSYKLQKTLPQASANILMLINCATTQSNVATVLLRVPSTSHEARNDCSKPGNTLHLRKLYFQDLSVSQTNQTTRPCFGNIPLPRNGLKLAICQAKRKKKAICQYACRSGSFVSSRKYFPALERVPKEAIETRRN